MHAASVSNDPNDHLGLLIRQNVCDPRSLGHFPIIVGSHSGYRLMLHQLAQSDTNPDTSCLGILSLTQLHSVSYLHLIFWIRADLNTPLKLYIGS